MRIFLKHWITELITSTRKEEKVKIRDKIFIILVANRIITVGDLGRAKTIAETFLDKPSNDQSDSHTNYIPQIFFHLSTRGFATYSGTY